MYTQQPSKFKVSIRATPHGDVLALLSGSSKVLGFEVLSCEPSKANTFGNHQYPLRELHGVYFDDVCSDFSDIT